MTRIQLILTLYSLVRSVQNRKWSSLTGLQCVTQLMLAGSDMRAGQASTQLTRVLTHLTATTIVQSCTNCNTAACWTLCKGNRSYILPSYTHDPVYPTSNGTQGFEVSDYSRTLTPLHCVNKLLSYNVFDLVQWHEFQLHVQSTRQVTCGCLLCRM